MIIMPRFNLVFKALADPTRRKIILLLKETDMTAGEIAGHFDMTKPSISHHLNVLKQSSLVTDERKGQNIYYSLNMTVFQEVINYFFNITHKNEGEIDDEKGK
jgi:DNA-binding transcriptional ArsR family regulator